MRRNLFAAPEGYHINRCLVRTVNIQEIIGFVIQEPAYHDRTYAYAER